MNDLPRAIADLQGIAVRPCAPNVLEVVRANNQRIGSAALALLAMEDHPGTFDAWWLAFAAAAEGGHGPA